MAQVKEAIWGRKLKKISKKALRPKESLVPKTVLHVISLDAKK